MAYDRGYAKRMDHLFGLVQAMLDEHHDDEAAILLFDLNKLHVNEWMEVRRRLLDTCMSHSLLSRLSLVLECSSSPALSGWDRAIPGLGRFSAHHEPTELFD